MTEIPCCTGVIVSAGVDNYRVSTALEELEHENPQDRPSAQGEIVSTCWMGSQSINQFNSNLAAREPDSK